MRPIRALLLYLAVVFIGGALLAPCLYWLAQSLAANGSATATLAAHPFHRFLDRSLLGLALLGLWPLLRHCGLRRRADIGFGTRARPPAEISQSFATLGSATVPVASVGVPPTEPLRVTLTIGAEILRGFTLGWASLACAALLAFLCRALALSSPHSAAELAGCLLSATLTAVIVAILEELLFRGALFGILRQAMPWPAALALSSAVYSLAHFIRSAATAAPVQWYSGLVLLEEMFRHPPALIPACLTLFVAGAILALAYQRTGALYFSIGLHAGWIFWLKSYHFLFHHTGPNQPFWGADNLLDGWLSFLILLAVLCLVALKKPDQA